MTTTVVGTIGPDGRVTYKGIPDVTARVFPLGQRETGQRETGQSASIKTDLKPALGKERDPAGAY